MKKKDEKKIGLVVGVINSEKVKTGKKKRNTGSPQKFWHRLVKIWFDLYAEFIPAPVGEEKAIPSFDTTEAFQMKIIVKELKARAEKNNIEWNEENACKRFEAFVRKSFDDDFISKNFMLRIISNNRTKIFNNQITPKKDGKGNRGNITIPISTTVKSETDFGSL